MRIIWKYDVEMGDTHLPPLCNPNVVHIGEDPSGSPCVWVEHDPEGEQDTSLVLAMIGTGHFFAEAHGNYVGTLLNGPFVWHFYARQA